MANFNDLNLSKTETEEQIDLEIKEKLGISLEDLKKAICSYTESHYDELSKQFVNIAPNGNYSLLMEDESKMADFIKSECSKIEGWKLIQVISVEKDSELLEFTFANSFVDDGDSMNGYAYIGEAGKIRHAFSCGEK